MDDSKPAFPRTAEGVTDWEKVFEDPASGLIPLIARAQSPESLRGCVMVIIQRLFTRQGDEREALRLTREIETMIAEAGGVTPTEAAVALMRQVKNHRIDKAHAFLAKKARKKKERRSTSAGKGILTIIYLALSRPKYLIAAVGVLGFLLMGVLAALTGMFRFLPETEGGQAAAPADGQGAGAPRAGPGGAGPAGTMPADKSAVPMAAPPFNPEDAKQMRGGPPTIVLKRLPLPRAVGDNKASLPVILPVMILRDGKMASDVCREMPAINHILNVAFSDALQRKSDFSASELQAIGRTVAGQLNAKLGSRQIIAMHLIRTPDLKVNGPLRCGLVPNAFHETLKTLIE